MSKRLFNRKILVLKYKKHETFLYIAPILCAAIDSEFFRLLPINHTMMQTIGYIVVLYSILLVAKVRKTKWSIIKHNTKYYLITVTLFLLTEYIYTTLKYREQSLSKFIQVSNGYLWIYLVIPLIYNFLKDGGIEKTMNTLTIITVATIIIILVFAVAYNYTRIQLFNVSYYKRILIRNGRLRLWDLCSLEGAIVLWCAFEILRRNNIIKNVIYIAMIMAALIYVEQTRMMQIAIIISIVMMYVFCPSRSAFSKLFKFFLVIITLFLSYLYNAGEEIASSFSIYGELGSSTRIRLAEVTYAFEKIKENPVLGDGLMLKSIRESYWSYTSSKHFGYTDIGFIGLFTQIGLWSVIIYIVPLIRFTKITVNAHGRNQYYIFCVGLLSFLFITSGTLLILNDIRIFLWPIMIAVFEYINITSGWDRT